jgi:hypothetical protein
MGPVNAPYPIPRPPAHGHVDERRNIAPQRSSNDLEVSLVCELDQTIGARTALGSKLSDEPRHERKDPEHQEVRRSRHRVSAGHVFAE